jgi:hypothetical protein
MTNEKNNRDSKEEETKKEAWIMLKKKSEII